MLLVLLLESVYLTDEFLLVVKEANLPLFTVFTTSDDVSLSVLVVATKRLGVTDPRLRLGAVTAYWPSAY